MIQSKPAVFLIATALLLTSPSPSRGESKSPVQRQLDELLSQVRGKRIGMITNPAGCDEVGRQDVDYILASKETTITAFFSPEHGLRGVLAAGTGDKDYIDPATSVPVYAIYKVRKAPTADELQNVDALVYDLQDVGARFYTFMWSMTLCLESAAENHKPFYIIDRPNPITGTRVEGGPNIKDYGLIGRLGPGAEFGIATRHGMTVGEIATMWNTEWMTPKADLHVIKMTNWKRGQWWDDTGRKLIPPSPNLRSLNAEILYPGTCIFEGSNISEGRGTDKPFETIGAPFIDGKQYAKALAKIAQRGVKFQPITFTPNASKHKGVQCGGVHVVVTDRDNFLPVRNGLNMLQTAYKLYPNDTRITSYTARLMGVPDLQDRIKSEPVQKIEAEWQPLLERFKNLRAKYLLYAESDKSSTRRRKRN